MLFAGVKVEPKSSARFAGTPPARVTQSFFGPEGLLAPLYMPVGAVQLGLGFAPAGLAAGALSQTGMPWWLATLAVILIGGPSRPRCSVTFSRESPAAVGEWDLRHTNK